MSNGLTFLIVIDVEVFFLGGVGGGGFCTVHIDIWFLYWLTCMCGGKESRLASDFYIQREMVCELCLCRWLIIF